MESLWVPLDRGFRNGITSLDRDDVRLTSHLLLTIFSFAPAPFQEAYGGSMGLSCQTFRDGTTSLTRDGVRLTSHSLLLELVGWVESPRQQLAPSMAYHMSVRIARATYALKRWSLIAPVAL